MSSNLALIRTVVDMHYWQLKSILKNVNGNRKGNAELPTKP